MLATGFITIISFGRTGKILKMFVQNIFIGLTGTIYKTDTLRLKNQVILAIHVSKFLYIFLCEIHIRTIIGRMKNKVALKLQTVCL